MLLLLEIGHLYQIAYCSSLNNITIPNSVTSIGELAFNSCSSLTIVTIERKDTPITTLGIDAFYETPILSGDNNSKIIYPVGIEYYLEPNWAKLQAKWEDAEGGTPTFNETWRYANIEGGIELTLYTGTDTEIVIPEKVDGKNVVKIERFLFGQELINPNTTITSVDMSKATKLKTIGDNAFRYCSALNSITIPDGVETIGKSAFSDCSSLKSIAIPNSVTSIGDWAFSDCSSLKSIAIPNSVTSIGDWAFSGCSSLITVKIERKDTPITALGRNAFDRTPILSGDNNSKIIYPVGIEYYLEPNWAELQAKWEDAEGGTPTFNETWRYANVEGGIELTLYTGTDTEIVIPEKVDGKNVVKIGDYLFGQSNSNPNTTITKVDMSKAINLKTIVDNAFFGCSSLTSITIPNSVTSIGNSAFSNSGLTSITIPNSVTSIGNSVFRDCALTSITIPNSVISIGHNAFSGCGTLASITIPNSVISIGNGAFNGCAFRSITIPNSVTSIGVETFRYCKYLSEITLPASFNGKDITNLYIPDGVTIKYHN